MNHTPARIFMFFLVLGLAFTHLSCSSNLSELTGSVSLEIPQSIVSRAIEDENEGSSELYVVAMAQGDGYASAQYKTIRAGSLSSEDRFMKLLDIPAEKNIRIVMSVIDSQGERKYYGSTETFYVQHGINVQNIRLARVNEAAGTVSNEEIKPGYATYNGHSTVASDTNNGASVSFFSNGWYTIKNSADLLLSAGVWEGSTSSVVHLTEYIYREIDPVIRTAIDDSEYVAPYPNIILTQAPKEYVIDFSPSGDATAVSNNEFTLRNGVRIQF